MRKFKERDDLFLYAQDQGKSIEEWMKKKEPELEVLLRDSDDIDS